MDRPERPDDTQDPPAERRLRRPRPLRPSPLGEDAHVQVGPPGSRRLSLSVVIPTHDDAERLERCLQALATAERRGIDAELIVVDADSTDGTAAVAERYGARVIDHAGSRGARFAAGAKAATGEWLLLLRPETMLDRGWDATLMVFASEERNRERAGLFSLRVADDPAAARRMRLRNRWMALFSGAQGIVIRRRFLVHLGGVADLRRGEDLLLARELGLGRVALFDINATVAKADWPSGGADVAAALLRLVLFRLHVPPRWLQALGD